MDYPNNLTKLNDKGFTLIYESDAGWHIIKHFISEKACKEWISKQGKYLDIRWSGIGLWETTFYLGYMKEQSNQDYKKYIDKILRVLKSA